MKKRNLALALALVMILTVLTGCGRVFSGHSMTSSQNDAKTTSGTYYDTWDDGEYYAADYGYAAPAAAYEEAGEAYYEDGAYYEAPAPEPAYSAESATQAARAAEVTENPAKLIYSADLSMETMEFDTAVEALTSLTSELGGYFEYSSVSDSGSSRRASYTVRVPAKNYRAFMDGAAGEQCHVLSVYEYTEDVSEVYYDTAGRLETQKTKLSRLQEFLLEAETMEDIIVLENAISETEETIDRLSGTLRHYDALVDYSTVTITLREVKVYEPEPDPTYGTRLGSAFMDGLKGFVEGLGDILVGLAYCWLWIVLIIVIVVLVLWLTRKRRAARRQARAEKKAQRQALRNQPVVYSTPADESKDASKEE